MSDVMFLDLIKRGITTNQLSDGTFLPVTENMVQTKVIGIMAKGAEQALQTFAKRKFIQIIDEGGVDEAFPIVKRLKDMTGKRPPKIATWISITINVEEGKHTPKALWGLMQKHVKKKGVIQYIMCLHQRGETDETRGTGMHGHIYYRHNCKDRCNFDKTLKKLHESCFHKGLTIKDNPHFKIQEHHNPHNFNYWLGIKVNDDKQLKRDHDFTWRDEIGIPHYATNLSPTELENSPWKIGDDPSIGD